MDRGRFADVSREDFVRSFFSFLDVEWIVRWGAKGEGRGACTYMYRFLGVRYHIADLDLGFPFLIAAIQVWSTWDVCTEYGTEIIIMRGRSWGLIDLSTYIHHQTINLKLVLLTESSLSQTICHSSQRSSMPQPTPRVNFIEAEHDLIVACDR